MDKSRSYDLGPRDEPTIPQPVTAKPLPLAEVRELMAPISADAVTQMVNDKICQEASQGKNSLYLRVEEVKASLGMRTASYPAVKAGLEEALNAYEDEGYVVRRLPGDFREPESWSLSW